MKIDYNNTDEMKKLSQLIHNDKYDYSLLEKTNRHSKIKIICKEHGIFEQEIYMHIKRKQGCPKCIGRGMTTEEFIEKSKKIHGDKYDYSLVKYKNNRINIKIICKEHGVFAQNTLVHLNGHGCPYCANCTRSNNEEFIEKSKKIHGDKYDYSLIKYLNAHIKIKIICKEHGIFEQTPNKHLCGRGCPKCQNSKGEKIVEKFLIEKNINYTPQKTFENCKNIKMLFFDFYLIDYNMCIEYDGDQHFEKYRFEKDNNKLLIRKKRDKIKNDFCKENNINLIRISYNEDIEKKLTECLKF